MQKVLGPIRRIRSTQSTLRQASIREKNGPSLGKIQVKNPHQRSPYAVNFEDRSQEETERQQRCARGDAWNLAKNIYKLKGKDNATFYSPAEEWVLPAASTKEPDEREFVVDSRACMHMVSKKDLNSAELETMRTSRNPTTVMTANGEVQTREEAMGFVKELDLFVTVKLLEDTPAVLTLGKLCGDHGYSHEWTSGQKPQLIKDGRRIQCSTGELRTNGCPCFIDQLFKLSYTFISNIRIAGSSTLHPASTRSESTSSTVRGDPSHEPAETKVTNKNGDNEAVRETRCMMCQNG